MSNHRTLVSLKLPENERVPMLDALTSIAEGLQADSEMTAKLSGIALAELASGVDSAAKALSNFIESNDDIEQPHFGFILAGFCNALSQIVSLLVVASSGNNKLLAEQVSDAAIETFKHCIQATVKNNLGSMRFADDALVADEGDKPEGLTPEQATLFKTLTSKTVH